LGCDGAGGLNVRQIDMAMGVAFPACTVLAQGVMRLREQVTLAPHGAAVQRSAGDRLELAAQFAAGELVGETPE
jgi:hypothetical protein